MNPARLSEDAIKATWDSGFQALPWKAEEAKSFLPAVNFKELLNAKDPATAVQAIDRRAMYLALANANPEDALEIMPLLSKEQFVAVIDYEGWQEDRLVIHNVIRWLDVYKHIGIDQMFKRFRDLDEEYQIGMLAPYVDLVDEEAFEKLSQEEQDQFFPLPCNTLWYRIKGNDEKVEEFVTALVQGGLGEDVSYTYSLLSHAAYVPPNEDEELIKQFRAARLEEDGFALYEESKALFAPFDGQRYYEQFKHADSHSETIVQGLTHHWNGVGLFLDAVMGKIVGSTAIDHEAQENMKISFIHLANMLASVCHVQPDDVSSLTRILDQSRHIVSLGLEVLSAGSLDRARDILMQERPKVIFQFGLSVVNTIRDDALDAIRQNDWPAADKIEQYYKQLKFGALLWTIDTTLVEAAGLETAEMLKGLFNRFPMVPEGKKGTDGAERIQFHPVGSVADVQKLTDAVAALRNCGRRPLEPVMGSSDFSANN